MRRTLIWLFALTLVLSACSKSPDPSAQPAEQTPAETPAQNETNPPPDASAPAEGSPQGGRPLPPKPQPAAEAPEASESAYEQVDFDMTYEQVAKIMGVLGKEVHAEGNYDERTLVEVYEYKHPKGTYRITFRNGVVNNKSASYS